MSTMQVRALRTDALKKQMITHETIKLDAVGTLAQHLLATFAHVGVPDGETSTGYQMIRPMRPEEIVASAVNTAELALQAFEEKGWIAHLPSIDELVADDTSPAGFRRQE